MPKVFYPSTYLCISLYIKLSLLFITVHLNFDFLFNQFLLCLKIMYIIPGLWGTEFFTYIFLSWFNFFRADITTSKSVLRVSYFFFYIFHPLVFLFPPLAWYWLLSSPVILPCCNGGCFCFVLYPLSLPNLSFLGDGMQVNYDGARKWYVEKSRKATLGFEMIINNLFSFILTIKSVPFFATVIISNYLKIKNYTNYILSTVYFF